jgi:hypothetical protein
MQPVILKCYGICVLEEGLYVKTETPLPARFGAIEISAGSRSEKIRDEFLESLKLDFCGQILPENLVFYSPHFLEHLEKLKYEGKIECPKQANGYMKINPI